MSDPPFWNPETEPLICRQRRQETADVVSFVFTAVAPRRFAYLPGQFATFDIPLPGGNVPRCYTLASTPTRPDALSITVKRVPGGPVSNWLHDHLHPGMALTASAPMGEFSDRLHPSPKALFLSAGSGITPLMAMARAHDDLASETDIIFCHSARSPDDLIFRDELALLARHRPGFRAVSICGRDAPRERWGGLRGRLTLPMLRLIAPDLAEREVFACGPAPYMAAVRAMLAEAGCDAQRYHEESFDFAATAAEQPVALEATAGFAIGFARSGRSTFCAPGTTILEAARAAGLRLPASCTKGMCGTCKSRLVSGSIDMRHAGGIRQREIEQGLILICCARPTSDLVIDR